MTKVIEAIEAIEAKARSTLGGSGVQWHTSAVALLRFV